jgi:hypothetical protein
VTAPQGGHIIHRVINSANVQCFPDKKLPSTKFSDVIMYPARTPIRIMISLPAHKVLT